MNILEQIKHEANKLNNPTTLVCDGPTLEEIHDLLSIEYNPIKYEGNVGRLDGLNVELSSEVKGFIIK